MCPTDPAQLAEYFTFRDFAHFIDLYLATVSLIRTPDDVRLLTYEVAQDMAAQQIRYAELTCTPYTHVLNGVPIEGYIEAIEDARVAAERDLGSGPALDLRHSRRDRRERGGGDRHGSPSNTVRMRWWRSVWADRRSAPAGPGSSRPSTWPAPPGLHSVPHAGESTGPQTIWDALEYLGAERIGHGTSATQDPRLLAHLAEHRIPLEVCPTSNIATRVVPDYAVAPDPRHGRRRRHRHDQLRRPADVRHHPEPGVRHRRRVCSGWIGPVWPRWPPPPSMRRSRTSRASS